MVLVKLLTVGVLTFLLSSCYSKGCWMIAQSVDCSAQPKIRRIQQWQKKDSIGNTNIEQRWRDFQECGAERHTVTINRRTYEDIFYEMPTVTCMKKKGYIKFLAHECRTTSQTKLNGLCN